MKAVILAGGGGTRLWPLSTPERPKQFQKLLSDKTLLEETIERVDFLKSEDIYIAINEKHLGLTRDLCPDIPAENIIIEPALRDTASCIGLATALIEKKHPGEVIVIIYADHLIKNKTEFQSKVKIAAKIAEKENTLNIIEVKAETPNTNFGYVKMGDLTDNIDGTEVFMLDSFTEKPNLQKAKEFVESGKYLWNTGIYVWKADTLLKYYEKLQPDTHKKLIEMAQNKEKITELYPTLEKISIDYAIMEKVNPKEVRLIKTNNLGWSDIGTWDAIWEELPKNQEKNIQRGDIQLINTKNSLIYGDNQNKKVAIVGLEDIIVIDTPNGLLICNKNQSKEIKKIQIDKQ